MRIAELSDRCGTSTATIKYYIRAGLLPAGERINATQSEYTDAHVARLRLINSLVQIGKLPLSKALDILTAIDNPDLPIQQVLGVAQAAITAESERYQEPESRAALALDHLITERGWTVHPGNPGFRMVLDVLSEFDAMGHASLYDILSEYGAAAEIVGTADISVLGTSDDRQAVIERAVVGTILGDVLLMGLRRLTQEHFSAQRYERSNTFPLPTRIPSSSAELS